MPEQDLRAGELDQAQKVADVIFPAGDEASRVVEPGKEAFDSPAAAIAAQRTSVLGGLAASAVGRDHLDPVAIAELDIEQVAVVAAVADQSRGEGADEPRVERGGDEVRLIR